MHISKTYKALIIIGIIVLLAAAYWFKSGNIQQVTNPGSTPQPASPAAESTPDQASFESGDNSEPDASSLLTLMDIFTATDDVKAAVIIQYQDTDADLFELGNEIFELAVLEKIGTDHVVLLQDGKRITLYLQSSPANNSGADNGIMAAQDNYQAPVDWGSMSIEDRVARAAATAIHLPPDQRLVREEKFAYVANKRKLLQDIRAQSIETSNAATWAFIQFEPSVQLDQVNGIRLSGTDESGFLKQHGLAHGDIITAVNGRKIDNEQAASNAIKAIAENRHLELVIERGSEHVTVVVDKQP